MASIFSAWKETVETRLLLSFDYRRQIEMKIISNQINLIARKYII